MNLNVRGAACRTCQHPAAQHSHFSTSTHCALRDCTCTRYRPTLPLTRLRRWLRGDR